MLMYCIDTIQTVQAKNVIPPELHHAHESRVSNVFPRIAGGTLDCEPLPAAGGCLDDIGKVDLQIMYQTVSGGKTQMCKFPLAGSDPYDDSSKTYASSQTSAAVPGVRSVP